MSIFDKITERVGDIVDEVMLPEAARRAHDEATRLIDAGEFSDAIEVLSKTLVAHPNVARTHFLIGSAHFQNDDLEKAVDALDRASQIRETPNALFYAALALEKLERFRDAQRYFHRAVSLQTDDSLAFDLEFGLGRINRELGRNDKALRHFKQALELWPDQFDVVAATAETLCDLGRFEEAEALLNAHERTGDHAQGIIVAAKLFEFHEAWESANKAWQRAIQLVDPRRKQDAVIGSVRTLIHMGEHQAATVELDRHSVDSFTDANQAEVAYFRGLAFERAENMMMAAAALDEARRIEPQHAQANIARGRIALAEKEENADMFFSRVLESDGERYAHECYFGLARFYEARADFLTARRMYREAESRPGRYTAEIQFSLGQLALRFGDAAEAILSLRAVPDRGEREEEGIAHALEMLRPKWELPDALQGPDDVNRTLRNLGTFLSSDPRLGPFVETHQALLEVMNTPLSVAILGEFNAGKSTVVNALVGEDVTPVGVVPTTAQQSVLLYGARKTARVCFDDGRVDETTFDDAKKMMKSNADEIERIEFTYPHPQLRVVNFWDTPGFNALNERHEQIASRALETAEAILWVMDANQVLSQTQLDRLDEVKNSAERLIVLINKADRVGPDAIETLVDYVQDNIGEQILAVFPVSALNAMGDDGDEGFDTFQTFFDAEIVQRAGRLKTIDATERLKVFAMVLSAFRQGTLDLVERLSSELDATVNWVSAEGNKLSKTWTSTEIETLADWSALSLQSVESEIAESLKPVGTWSGKLALKENDRAFLLELVEQRLGNTLDRSFQRVIRELSLFEADLSERVTPWMQSLPTQNARAIARRYESFFEETRRLKVLLDERVYGHMRAEGRGKIKAAGATAIKAIEYAQTDRSAWRAPLRSLVPEFGDDLRDRFMSWFREFFDSTLTFCDRLRSELDLLRLESEHRLDVAEFEALFLAETGEESE